MILGPIVLTEQTAQKYFGKENPIGKRLTVDEKYEFQVSGILKDLPKNSHINIDFLCPLNSARIFMVRISLIIS